MTMVGLIVLLVGVVILVVTLTITGDRRRCLPYDHRQVVMHELAERYAQENYVLLTQAVGVLERLLDDDTDLPVFTGTQRNDAQEIVRRFHQRQLKG